MEDFFNSIGKVRSIADTDKTMCNTPITILEVKNAMKKLKLNKSPGTDWLTSKFYKLFSTELAPFLLNVLIEYKPKKMFYF